MTHSVHIIALKVHNNLETTEVFGLRLDIAKKSITLFFCCFGNIGKNLAFVFQVGVCSSEVTVY